jgi:iron(III) transport system substrate-binding protein
VEKFRERTGIEVRVRYGGTSELAVLIAEEGAASPADLFWAQDGGALGSLESGGFFAPLPASLLRNVPPLYRGANDAWVALSGRARVLAYSPLRVKDRDAPASIYDLALPDYRGRVGWAPANASLQAQITAMRVANGDDHTAAWLRAMVANGTKAYGNNTALIEAIAAGEIDYAIPNNYYLLRYLAADPGYPVAQRFFAPGDIGNLVNVAGAGILKTAKNPEGARKFLEFLLGREAQAYFTNVIYEYPVVDEVPPDPRLASTAEVVAAAPKIRIGSISDLGRTLELMRSVGTL